MFDKFGEFNSAEELNMAAEGQFNEGDMTGLKALAKENGIPEELVEMYANGDIPYLCDAQLAAEGKIAVEMEEIRKNKKVDPDMAQAIADYMLSRADEEKVAADIRRKGKTIAGCVEAMRQVASKKKKTNNMVCIAPAEGFRIVREYYES